MVPEASNESSNDASKLYINTENDVSIAVEGDDHRRKSDASSETHYHEFVHPN